MSTTTGEQRPIVLTLVDISNTVSEARRLGRSPQCIEVGRGIWSQLAPANPGRGIRFLDAPVVLNLGLPDGAYKCVFLGETS